MFKDERFERIYRSHYARVWRFYRSCGVSDDESHDLAQDAFKRFFERMEQFRGEDETIWPFLKQIALNVLRNRVRDRKAIKRSATLVEIDDPSFMYDPPAPEGPDLAEREQQSMRAIQLRQAVAELSAGQRECFRLWVQGFKYEEIAKVLRITVDAVKSRLRDARKHLRARLGEES